jgi:tight adherence protein B
MTATPTWLMPALAGLVAAVLVMLLARPERTMTTAQPAKARSGESWWPSLMMSLAAAALVGWLSERPGPTVAVLALTLGVTGLVRSRRRLRRSEEEERHAVEAIGSASRALRAGIPLSGMLQILADESRGETRVALREVMQRESMGEELASAIRHVLLQSPLASLRAFGLALIIQLSAGGNLADTTDRLALSLVERARVRRRARTIMAYSRTAANVLAIAPLVAIPILASSVEGYTRILLDQPAGNLLLAAAAVMLIAGLIAIQRLSRIERLPDWGTR